MDRISLKATERTVFGKKVKRLRRDGMLPGNVYGNTDKNEAVSVKFSDFIVVYNQAGETGLLDLKIGVERVRPVLIRDVQYDPVKDTPVHVDFYQVNLLEKVSVPVPIHVMGEEPEVVHKGEAVVLQVLNEVMVEALPTDLIESLEVDVSSLQNVDDAVTVGQLRVDKSKITILAEEDEIVVKLAPAVTAEMEALLAEQEAEAQAAVEEAAVEEAAPEGEGGEVPLEKEAEEGVETKIESQAGAEGNEVSDQKES